MKTYIKKVGRRLVDDDITSWFSDCDIYLPQVLSEINYKPFRRSDFR